MEIVYLKPFRRDIPQTLGFKRGPSPNALPARIIVSNGIEAATPKRSGRYMRDLLVYKHITIGNPWILADLLVRNWCLEVLR